MKLWEWPVQPDWPLDHHWSGQSNRSGHFESVSRQGWLRKLWEVASPMGLATFLNLEVASPMGLTTFKASRHRADSWSYGEWQVPPDWPLEHLWNGQSHGTCHCKSWNLKYSTGQSHSPVRIWEKWPVPWDWPLFEQKRWPVPWPVPFLNYPTSVFFC